MEEGRRKRLMRADESVILESGSVFFECKEGPFVSHEVDGIL